MQAYVFPLEELSLYIFLSLQLHFVVVLVTSLPSKAAFNLIKRWYSEGIESELCGVNGRTTRPNQTFQ